MTIDTYRQILTKYWGFTSFKPLQEQIILSVAEGRDTLGLMPTGGGKSITFQVPAMAHDGICLVVTPLIS
jgi:ATP-dependent DNA helicase RecQ